MGVEDIIEQTTNVRELRQPEEPETTRTAGGTLQFNISALSEPTSANIEFWLLVVQTGLLAYIAWKI